MKEFPLIKFKKISIPKSYSNLDVIRIRPTVAPFYSEKLIDTLLDFGISGLEPKYKNSITLDLY